MNKTAKIIIAIEALIILFYVVVAQIERAEGDKLKLEAVMNYEMKEKYQKEAEIQAEQAQNYAAQALLAQNEAKRVMEALQKCQSGK